MVHYEDQKFRMFIYSSGSLDSVLRTSYAHMLLPASCIRVSDRPSLKAGRLLPVQFCGLFLPIQSSYKAYNLLEAVLARGLQRMRGN